MFWEIHIFPFLSFVMTDCKVCTIVLCTHQGLMKALLDLSSIHLGAPLASRPLNTRLWVEGDLSKQHQFSVFAPESPISDAHYCTMNVHLTIFIDSQELRIGPGT